MTPHPTRRHRLITALSGAAASLPLAAIAQDAKPLEWVLGYPAGSSSDIVARTRAEQMRKTLGLEPLPGTPQQMAAYAKAERARWGQMIKANGIKLD